MENNLKEKLAVLIKEEDVLRFNSFDNEEAWKLGCFMVERVKKKGIDLAICIRKTDENIVFQYASEGTNFENQFWMNKKFNTVMLNKTSSLRADVEWQIKGEQLPGKEYAGCGGGFPIRLKNDDEIKMVLTVSQLPHVDDHNFIIESLSEYLKINVDTISGEIEMLE